MTDNLLAGIDNAQPEIDPTKDYRAEFVGEGKKYKTEADAFRALAHAQRHIPIVETKADQLREDYLKLKAELDSKATLEALVDKIEKSRQQPTNSEQPKANEGFQRPDPNELKSLVSQEVLAIENSRKQQQNYQLVEGKLKERYGDNFSSVVKKQMDALGISDARLNEMARNEPQVLIRALGLDAPVTPNRDFQAPPRSSLRSDNFAPTTNQKRTWSFYQKMRKENPELYHSRQTNINMERDAVALGAEFQDGDFNVFN